MSEFSVVTAAERDTYKQLNDRLDAARTPEFLNHDAAVVRYWGLLVECFPNFQFLLVENATGGPTGPAWSSQETVRT